MTWLWGAQGRRRQGDSPHQHIHILPSLIPKTSSSQPSRCAFNPSNIPTVPIPSIQPPFFYTQHPQVVLFWPYALLWFSKILVLYEERESKQSLFTCYYFWWKHELRKWQNWKVNIGSMESQRASLAPQSDVDLWLSECVVVRLWVCVCVCERKLAKCQTGSWQATRKQPPVFELSWLMPP